MHVARPILLRALLPALTLALLCSPNLPAQQGTGTQNWNWFQYDSGLGVNGYDLVSFFVNHRAQRGYIKHAVDYAGERWYFTNKRHAKVFRRDPERYLPAYGAHCAFGASRGYLVRGEPKAWTVHDGKLYLNYNRGVRRTWLKDIDNYIARADANWPQLRDAPAPGQ